MKPRIKIDGLMMIGGIIGTFVLFQFPALYPSNRMLDDALDFIGVFSILSGLFLRMTARGHKKRLSSQGWDLVTSGPYKLVRNPMYLGTYLLGAGFFLSLCPWWVFPIYTVVFYRRFRRQIIFEEKYLHKLFGERYDDYCLKTPRLFPDFFGTKRVKMRDAFPWGDVWTTKEKRAIIPALLGLILLETVKEQCVFAMTDPMITVLIVVTAAGIFSLGLWVRYQEN